jgi:uncharacterized protein YodC (DUF2158 family)
MAWAVKASSCLFLLGCTHPAVVLGPIALPTPPISSACVDTVRVTQPKKAAPELDYTSNFGIVHRLDTADGSWTGTYTNGILVCEPPDGDTTRCSWYEGGSEGRAVFVLQSTGELVGTWGTGTSAEDGGDWKLAPIVRGVGLEGSWETNWGPAMVTVTGSQVHVVYRDGTMDCNAPNPGQLTCQWVEGQHNGSAELTVESDRLMRGLWGNGASSTDGGKWIFIRR